MRNKIKIIIILSISVLIGSGSLASANLYAQDLVILHTNDTHSQVEPVAIGRGKGKGGVFRRAEYFKKIKAENKNVLILDAGDYNQGTPYFTVFNGDMEIELMNALGYDVTALGNHEFDNGQEELARRLSSADFATLCANYDFKGTPLARYVKPYVIVKRGGKKIGIIGLILELSSVVPAKAIEGLKYTNAIEAGNKYARFLKEKKKCDIVIALTHIGYRSYSTDHLSDIALAEKSENIDIIVGGHSHTYLKTETLVKNKSGKEVVVLQAGSRGEYVGRLDLDFE